MPAPNAGQALRWAGSGTWAGGFSLGLGGIWLLTTPAGMERDARGRAPPLWALCTECELFLIFAVKLRF